MKELLPFRMVRVTPRMVRAKPGLDNHHSCFEVLHSLLILLFPFQLKLLEFRLCIGIHMVRPLKTSNITR